MFGGVHATAYRWLQQHGSPVTHCEYYPSQWYLRRGVRSHSGPVLILTSPATIHEVIAHECMRYIRHVLGESGFLPGNWISYISGQAVDCNYAGQHFVLQPDSSLLFLQHKVPWLVLDVAYSDTAVHSDRKVRPYLFGTQGLVRYGIVVNLYNHESYTRQIINPRQQTRRKLLVQDELRRLLQAPKHAATGGSTVQATTRSLQVQAAEEIRQRLRHQPDLLRCPHDPDGVALLSRRGKIVFATVSVYASRIIHSSVGQHKRLVTEVHAEPIWPVRSRSGFAIEWVQLEYLGLPRQQDHQCWVPFGPLWELIAGLDRGEAPRGEENQAGLV
ncbi:hypothetical protein FN846DRAFT_895709 [Sphaerosporella brunnea]|uniref:Uncharacterized protein n=1 Tax=Sphaerosporella brunnea TaxID=1250544 RepID=A0A5J5EET8_9PEZI|nr:hypothetical protein FN846DRAFT_895709 [Sphaerosporella brunnea]